jgi:hypothetical protein
MKINIKILSTYRRPKIMEAVKIIEAVVPSEAYGRWFLNFDFSQLDQDDFADDKGIMLVHILENVRVQYQVVSRPWYKRWSSVIGYTQNGVITTYRSSFDSMSTAELAGHLWHEILHLKGYGHTVQDTWDRERSIPYACGNKVEEMGKLL